MWRCILSIPVILTVTMLLLPDQASAADCGKEYDFHSLSKDAQKEVPILERPHYRPGHFYGNTVRRRYARGVSRGYDENGNPVTRLAKMMEERM